MNNIGTKLADISLWCPLSILIQLSKTGLKTRGTWNWNNLLKQRGGFDLDQNDFFSFSIYFYSPK